MQSKTQPTILLLSIKRCNLSRTLMHELQKYQILNLFKMFIGLVFPGLSQRLLQHSRMIPALDIQRLEVPIFESTSKELNCNQPCSSGFIA